MAAGNLGDGDGSAYPGSLDTSDTEVNSPNAGKTKARAEVENDQYGAIIAIETELGTDPAGSATDLKTRLAVDHAADGTHSSATLAGATTVSGTLAGAGWPSFSVHKNGTNQVTVGTAAEIITWSTEEFDTNSDFAVCDTNCDGSGAPTATQSRFTPTVAGKYLLTVGLGFATDADQDVIFVTIEKNGTTYKEAGINASGAGNSGVYLTVIADANGSTDYFEVWGANSTTADTVLGSASGTFFQGSRIG